MLKIDALLQKEMTRKEFLLVMASAVGGLLGISSFLGIFTKTIQPSHTTAEPGYGDRHYGP